MLTHSLLDAIESLGINADRLPAHPTIGKWYYLQLIGKKNSNTSGRVKVLCEGTVFIMNMATNEKTTWFAYKHTDKESLSLRIKESNAAQVQIYQAQQNRYERAANIARSMWFKQSTEPDTQHPYLLKKVLKPDGLKQLNHELIVPVYSFVDGEIQSLQFISHKKNEQGSDKRFLRNGKISGGYFATRQYKADEPIVISEGWATSQSLEQQWHVKGWHVCAFNANGLVAIAKQIRSRYPLAKIIIAADNDFSGTGQVAAAQAAKTIGASVSMPEFTVDERTKYGKVSDWQDRWMIDQSNKNDEAGHEY